MTVAGSLSSPDGRRRQRARSKLTLEEQECFEKIPVLLNTRHASGDEDWFRTSPARRDAERVSPLSGRSNIRKDENEEGNSPKAARQVLVPLLPTEEETAAVLDKILPRDQEELREKATSFSRSKKSLTRSAVDRSPFFGGSHGGAISAASPEKTPISGGRLGSPGSPGGGHSTTNALTLPLPHASVEESDRTSPARKHGRNGSDGFFAGFSGGLKTEGGIDKKSRTRNLIGFRQKILEKCHTVRLAFEMFALETSTGLDKELTQKQFARFCAKHWNFPGMTRDVYEHIFDMLDINKDGLLSMSEFHNAIELAGPVRTLEDLRRKWIALGFTSMRRALQAMVAWEGQPTSLRLNLLDFGAALSRTGVEDEEEHRAIFSKLRDPGEDAHGTVSIDLLAAAIGAVSPSLLLEDLRDRTMRKHSSLDKAFYVMDERNQGYGPKGRKVFMLHCTEMLKFSRIEAEKAFELLDFDNSWSVTHKEYMTALNLSEPDLFLEEVRRKVRQRYKSITDAMATSSASHHDDADQEGGPAARSLLFTEIKTAVESAKEEPTAEDMEAQPQTSNRINTDKSSSTQEQGPAEYKELLSQVFLTEADTQALFELIDSNGDGRLTPMEFARGLSHFAPSCILEEMRLKCLRHYGSVVGAFSTLSQQNREELFDKAALQKLLADLGLCEGRAALNRVFACVETQQHGGISIEELKAALRAVGPGDHAPLDAELRDAKARQQVRFQMAPFRRTAVELRSLLREGGEPLEQAEQENDAAALLVLSESGPQRPSTNQRRKDCLTHPVPRTSFERFSVAMKAESDTVAGIHGYYKTCSDSMVSANSLLARPHRRYSTYTEVARHKLFLEAGG